MTDFDFMVMFGHSESKNAQGWFHKIHFTIQDPLQYNSFITQLLNYVEVNIKNIIYFLLTVF